MIEIFTRPLTIYNSSEPINSALFSKAKPLRSSRLVLFNFDQKRCNKSEGFRALFVYSIFFLSVFSKAAFISFTIFPQILNYVS